MLVLVAPGQGAQTPGFLAPWLDLDGVADRLRWWSAVTGLDLIHYGTKADADEIRDTAVAQPLLVASGLVAALALFPHPSDAYRVVGAAAGHSVGELTAAAGTGVITAESAMTLVRERGRAMAAAAAVTRTGMSAVLGGDSEQVLAKIAEHGLTPANMNGAGQIVAAGTLEQLAAFAADPPEKARVRPLAVAGAFHTEHMASAVKRLAELVPGVTVRDPRTPFVSNSDGAVLHDGRDVVKRLITQVSSPVRWDLCMETMRDLGVTGIIEVAPAGTLTGLAKRALPGVETVALKTPDDLEAARKLVDKHGSPSTIDASPTWRLVVAPFKGIIELTDIRAGDALVPGTRVATVRSHRDEQTITVPHGGTVVEWLVEDGDPVAPGMPLLRIHPQSSL
ncbi:acyltransferase domain-containing protein [Streptomyces sp. SID3343]|uniref:acyltransferase domain-containing protein n=1 Tax=Streptomyces sp. SID3343 TaxID=2690260 RepID=UPI00136924CD|nr:acyltransferase domain-containing protein [Streptomyces sp. SID3343]